MIAILDYDAGNIKSVEKALNHLGQETILTRDFQEIRIRSCHPGSRCQEEAISWYMSGTAAFV